MEEPLPADATAPLTPPHAAYQRRARQAAAPGLGRAETRALLAQALAQQQALLAAPGGQLPEQPGFLLRLADALRPLADAVAIQDTIARLSRTHFGAERCYYGEIAEGRCLIRRDAAAEGLPSVAGTYDLATMPLFRAVLAAQQPIVVEDVRTTDLVDEGLRQTCVALAAISCINVPIVKNGEPVGIWCVVQAAPRAWTADEVALAAAVAERTWAAVERARAEAALRASEARTRLQKEAFQAAIDGQPLAACLNVLARLAPEQVGEGVRTAFYLASADGASLHSVAGAGDMPAAYAQAADGFLVAPTSFCSGLTIATGRPALTPDVCEDPLWEAFRPLAATHGFRAAGSYPILTRQGQAVGSFAMYFPAVHEATAADFAVAGAVTQAAAIILSHHGEAVERARAEAALRASEEKFRTLFDSIDEGYCLVEVLLDADGQPADLLHLEVNQAYQRKSGLGDITGKRMRGFVPDLEPKWLAFYGNVALSGQPARMESWSDALGRWFSTHAARVGGAGSRLVGVVFDDITQRKEQERRQQLLLQIGDALRPLADAIQVQRAAVDCLAAHFEAESAVYVTFGPDGDSATLRAGDRSTRVPFPRQVRLSDFGPAFFADFTAGRTIACEDVETDPRLAAHRAAYRALGIRSGVGVPLLKHGRLTAALVLNHPAPRRWTAAETRLLEEVAERTWDAVERARTEEALRESETRLRTLLDNLPGAAVFIISPALRFALAAGEALALAGHTPADFVGRRMADAPAPDARAIYEPLLRQALAGQPFVLEHEVAGRAYVSRGVPLPGAAGAVSAVLVVSYDITVPRRTEQARQQSEERLRIAVEAAEQGTWDWDLTTDEVRCNARQSALFGLEPRPDEPVAPAVFERHLHPDDRDETLRSLQAAVAGQRVFEAEFRVVTAPGEVRWLSGYGQATDPGPDGRTRRMSGVVFDITRRKHTEQQLQELAASLEGQVAARTAELQISRDLLQSVFDTSLVAMTVFEAVRDAAGAVQDFRIVSVNKEHERMTQRPDLVGRLLAQEYPGTRAMGLFDSLVRAVDTGQPQILEYHHHHEGLGSWYASQFVKLGDGVVATSLDITERKYAEQGLRQSLGLLEQSEEVAQLGSWVSELATGELRWSAGMYRLFGLAPGPALTPAIYFDYVVPDDRAVAELLVEALTTAPAAVDVTLRVRVGEAVKTLRVKTVVLCDEHGTAVQVLGIDLDVTELQRLAADNLRLQLGQQQALFEAVQAAQEEERRRIAESLHNGLGQLLYAIKLQLDRLPPEARQPAHREAAHLLGEAIQQARALSHELTPALLEEFGLEAALQSICRTLSNTRLHWHCHFELDEGPALPMPLRLAVYRLAQELVQNVVKHAQATEATLEVTVLPHWAVLRVEDSGRGFDPANTSDGLGLRTLRSRAALLGGTVRLTSAPGQGTHCQVRFPLTPLTPLAYSP